MLKMKHTHPFFVLHIKPRILPFLLPLLLLSACTKTTHVNDLKIIPEPVSIEKGDNAFLLEDNISISISGLGQNSNTVKYILNSLRHARIQPNLVSHNEKSVMQIIVHDSLDLRLGDEGYHLEITPDGIVFSANTEQGLFYAYQTFIQMLPSDIVEHSYSTIELPLCNIVDYPRYPWRAVYLDVCSHYYSPNFIKKVIDIMANYKMNRLVWHLADDHGWRIPSQKYPALDSVGAWRVNRRHADWYDTVVPRPNEKPTYGGFYSKQDITDIVDYAASRNIEVIPSIELPGLCSPILAAYPQFSCDSGDYPIPYGAYSSTTPILCAGNDSTLLFLNNILDEITDLFPAKHIHIGGSEAPLDNWRSCPKCRKRMMENHLTHNDQLFVWLLRQAAQHLNKLGRVPLTWDLPDNATLIPGAIVTAQSISSGIGAAQAGNQVVMCPPDYCLFSRYQANPDHQPRANDGITTLAHVYSFDPVPLSTPKFSASNIIGAQCLLTTEHFRTEDIAEYMLLPRLLAFSEALWSSGEGKNWNRFRRNVEEQKIRLRAKSYNYCEGSFMPIVHTRKIDNNTLSVTVSTEVPNTYIFYTTDGTTPSRNSQVYVSPIQINPNTTLKILSVYHDKQQDSVYEYILP